uniref:Phospholipase C beta 1 n=2 Tax=Cercopithecinae TaxID=9528 RepID=A0A2K5P7C1_CERAT|nr:unnamed protein product [Macaca fascicularis]
MKTCLSPFLTISLIPRTTPTSQLANWLETPLLRCIAKCFCLVVAVWSWTAGRDELQKRNLSSPMASP